MSEISSQRQGKLHCVNAVTAFETGNQAQRAAGSTNAGCAWCVTIIIINSSSNNHHDNNNNQCFPAHDELGRPRQPHLHLLINLMWG